MGKKSKPNTIKRTKLVNRASELKAATRKKKQSHKHLHRKKAVVEAKARMLQSSKAAKRLFRPEMRTLLVGEGNFSFARALVRRWGHEAGGDEALHAVEDLPGFNLVATCLDNKKELVEKYPDVKDIVREIKGCGGTVITGVDGTKLLQSKRVCTALTELCPEAQTDDITREGGAGFGFDRVVFNFPHLGCGIKDTEANNQVHRDMLKEFFQSAFPLLADRGQVLVTVKVGEPYDSWRVPHIALETGLFKVRASEPFLPDNFDGYEHRRTLGAPTNALQANVDVNSSKASARTLIFEKLDLETAAKNNEKDDVGKADKARKRGKAETGKKGKGKNKRPRKRDDNSDDDSE